MKIEEARELLEQRRIELESGLSNSDGWVDKRSFLSGLSSVAQMLCYLDLLERGDTPIFRIIDAPPCIHLTKEVFA